MGVTNKQLALRAKKKREYLDNLPATTFPKVINPHSFQHSTVVGDKTCLECGQPVDNKLHIRPHYYQANYSSKLLRCMCGLNMDHFIHLKEA